MGFELPGVKSNPAKRPVLVWFLRLVFLLGGAIWFLMSLPRGDVWGVALGLISVTLALVLRPKKCRITERAKADATLDDGDRGAAERREKR